MTVTALLLNFRAALLALVPIAEEVSIAWKRLDSYDEWDAIADVLFEKFVVELLRSTQPEKSQQGFRLPSYDLVLQTYTGLATLEVFHPSLQHGRWLFHAFGTVDEPFDVIEVLLLGDDGALQSTDILTCPVDGAAFYLRAGSQAHLQEEFEIADL